MGTARPPLPVPGVPSWDRGRDSAPLAACGDHRERLEVAWGHLGSDSEAPGAPQAPQDGDTPCAPQPRTLQGSGWARSQLREEEEEEE